ncbi:MAG: hypothetical protein PHE27_04855, partial [Alphaproteobacteria bacterium]|nr:hypothetical protein [Alphaproteobacteria bacterium]
TTGISGAVSSANSLVGSQASDWIGWYGATALSDGNYVIINSYWDSDTITNLGAITWGNGTTGTSGVLSSANSIINPSGNAVTTIYARENTSNGSFLVSFYSSSATSKVAVGLPDPSLQTYSMAGGNDMNLLPSFLTSTLDAGTAVTLQASNSITVNSDITVTPSSGDGGALTFQAGNSILINADITTANGDLTLIANDTTADGVVDAYREAGAASITMADGTALNAGTGDISISLLDGSGNTNNTVGTITLGTLSASTVTLTSLGGDVSQSGSITASTLDLEGAGAAYTLTNAGNAVNALIGDTGTISYSQASGLTLGNGSTGLTTSGDMLIVLTGSSADLTLANAVSASGTDDALVLVSGRNVINNGGSLSASGGGRWLVYATTPANDTLTGLSWAFRRYSCSYGGSCPSYPSTGNGFLYSVAPTLTASPTTIRLIYAEAAPDLSSYNYTLSGFFGSDASLDTLSGSLTGITAYTQGSGAGRYAVTYLSGSLSSAMGYAFSYADNLSGILVLSRQLPDTVAKNSQKPATPALISSEENKTEPDTFVLANQDLTSTLSLTSELSIKIAPELRFSGIFNPWEN